MRKKDKKEVSGLCTENKNFEIQRNYYFQVKFFGDIDEGLKERLQLFLQTAELPGKAPNCHDRLVLTFCDMFSKDTESALEFFYNEVGKLKANLELDENENEFPSRLSYIKIEEYSKDNFSSKGKPRIIHTFLNARAFNVDYGVLDYTVLDNKTPDKKLFKISFSYSKHRIKFNKNIKGLGE